MDRVRQPDHVNSILSVLGISKDDLAPGLYIQNAATSRVKTLIPLESVHLFNTLELDLPRVKELCQTIGSTGLYPYAISNLALQEYEARQFPQKVGYPEDAATGIAASALAFGLLVNGSVHIVSDRARAMGKPSKMFDSENQVVTLMAIGWEILPCSRLSQKHEAYKVLNQGLD